MKMQDAGVMFTVAVAGFVLAWTTMEFVVPCAADLTRLPPELNKPVRVGDVELTFRTEKELYETGDTPSLAVTARRISGTNDNLQGRIVVTTTPAPSPMMRMMPRPRTVWSNDFTVAFHGKEEWSETLRMDRPVEAQTGTDSLSGMTNNHAAIEFVFEDWTHFARVVVSGRMKGTLPVLPRLTDGKTP